MDKKAIETLSVNAVRDSIVISDYLDQFIADNDKEPSWDGFVYIYYDKSKKKSKLKGRLPVQVKGTKRKDHFKEEISFPVSTIDLKNYLNDGGIVLFVVYISDSGEKKQIYYVELPPIKIRVLLSEAKDQQTKSIKLKKFPDDSNMKAMIFYNCFENCQKQASFCSAKLLSLEELEKEGILEGVSISVSTVGGIDPKSALLSSELYLYANTKGSVIPQPIEALLTELVTTEEKDAVITVGDHLFYKKVKLIRSAEYVTTMIGESFSIVASIKDHLVRMTFKGTDSLRSLAVDLDFILSYIENKGFTYNGVDFPYNDENADFSDFPVDYEKQRLTFLKKAVQALDCLGCKKDLSIKSLTQKDWLHLGYLIKAFVDKEPVSGLKDDLPGIMSIDVGSLKFIINLIHVEGETNTYEIFDFFKTELSMVYENQNGEMLPISQYVILHVDNLLNADNLRCDVMLPSFQKIERHSELVTRANYFMLELLEAYDKDNSRVELLSTAAEFADWLMEASEEELPYDVRLLNKIQIEKRMGNLSITRIRELFRMVETPNTREDIKVGAYLLLNQQTAAELHFEKMETKLQEEFKRFPIYHFWKENE